MITFYMNENFYRFPVEKGENRFIIAVSRQSPIV